MNWQLIGNIKGQDGADGRDVDTEALNALVDATVAKKIASLPLPEPGKDGRDGIDGKGVDPIEVQGLIEAKVADAVAQLPKPVNGKDGAPGKDADPEVIAAAVAEQVAKIPAPANGKDADPEFIRAEIARAVEQLPRPQDGKSVPIEEVQKMVADAVAEAVSQIRAPKDGDPGRDAVHIEILPAIDAERSYPRGTYAKHAGGLWRSFETTFGMKGWECIVEGIKSAVAIQAQDDPRAVSVEIETSSGVKTAAAFSIPMVFDKGVYKPGVAYLKGDGVTWAGSYWIAKRDTESKPDGGEDWRLAVKRGRDGKDADVRQG